MSNFHHSGKKNIVSLFIIHILNIKKHHFLYKHMLSITFFKENTITWKGKWKKYNK